MATAENDVFDISGRVNYVDPAINPRTGTLRVRSRFENRNGVLLPGMFVRARVLLDTAPAVVAPDIALLSDQTGRYALVVNDKNVVEARPVKIAALDGTMRVVESGLTVDDRIVVNGLERARPGVNVKPTLRPLVPTTWPSTRSNPQP